jgi:membrane protease YdiL (CAAX protease family)
MDFLKNVQKGGNQLYQYIFTIVFVIFGYIIGQVPMFAVILYRMQTNIEYGKDELEKFSKNPDFQIFGIDRNIGFILILLTFVGAMSALLLSIKYIHKRSWKSIFSFSEKIDFSRIFWSSILWCCLLLFFEIIIIMMYPSTYSFRMPGYSFIFLMLISLIILPIQTSFEELLVRGYVFQFAGFNLKSPIGGYIISVLVFAALHLANPEIEKYGLYEMLSYYLIAGLFLGAIVIFDDRIELAIGVHTATNVFGALFVSYKGAAIQTDSLYQVSSINPLLQALEIFGLGLLFLILAYRKYKWNFTNFKLFDKSE